MSLKNYIAQDDYIIIGDSTEMTPQMQRTIDSLTASLQLQKRQEKEAHNTVVTVLSTIVVVVIFGAFFGFWIFNNAYWGRGKFPPLTRFKRVNYYDSIVYIAVRFMLCDRDSYSNKLVSLSQYLKRKFPDIPGHPMDSVRAASETPVSVESTSFWLNKHLSLKEKQELFSFFGQMAISDGGLGRREHEYLTIILKKWGLDQSLLTNLEEEINTKRRAEAARENQRTVRSSIHLKDKYLQVLGLQSGATAEDIKKAYRKLAMVHHPDKYQGNNDFEREAANMKFIALQEAYEYLCNLTN